MAYNQLNFASVEQLAERFRQRKIRLDREGGTNTRSTLEADLAEAGRDVQLELAQSMRLVDAYVAAHTQLVEGRVRNAKEALKTAKTKVSQYQKNPAQNPNTLEEVTVLTNTVSDYTKEIDEDRNELDRAWSSVRTGVVLDVTDEYLRDFTRARDAAKASLKALGPKGTLIVAVKRELKALQGVADKIKNKAAAKVSPQSARSPQAVKEIAAKVHTRIVRRHDEITRVNKESLRPASITTAVQTLKGQRDNQGWTGTPGNLKVSRDLLAKAEMAYKTVSIQAKSAAKEFATGKKSIRPSELQYQGVGPEINGAAKVAEKIDGLLKTATADIAKARKYLAEIEKKFERVGQR